MKAICHSSKCSPTSIKGVVKENIKVTEILCPHCRHVLKWVRPGQTGRTVAKQEKRKNLEERYVI